MSKWYNQNPTAKIIFPTPLEANVMSEAETPERYMELVTQVRFVGPDLDITFMPAGKYMGRIYDKFKLPKNRGLTSAYDILNEHVAYGDKEMIEHGSGCFQVVLNFGLDAHNTAIFFLRQSNPFPSVIPFVDGESTRYVYKYKTFVTNARPDVGLRIDAIISYAKRGENNPDEFEVEMMPYIDVDVANKLKVENGKPRK